MVIKKNFLKVVSAVMSAVMLAVAVTAAPMPIANQKVPKAETELTETKPKEMAVPDTKATEAKPEETTPAETAAQESVPQKSPTDYTGKWHWKHNNENLDVKVRITENTIAIYLHIVNTDMGIFGNEIMALYWYGTYMPPAKAGKHTWTSNTLLTEKDRPLFATSEPMKTFVYENGEITFPLKLTFAGDTIDSTVILVPYTAEDGSACENGHVSFTVEKNSLGGVDLHAIVEVKNTGTTDLYLDESTFYFCDEEGVILKEDNYAEAYPKIISPGNSGYYYADTTLENVDSVEEFRLTCNMNIYTSRSVIAYLETYDTKFTEESFGGVEASVKVKNPIAQEIKPTVVVVLFDKDKKPIDVMTKTYETIPANATKRIELSNWYQPEGITLDDVAYYKVFSYVADDQYNFDW